MTFDLSVITPVYNAAATLPAQLDSLVRQHTRASWELIIADNGSTDATPQILAQYGSKIPHLQVVDASAKPASIAFARNMGVAAARSPLLVFLDADDEAGPGWLAAMHAALERHPMVCCRLAYDKLNQELPASLRKGPQTRAAAKEYGFLPYCTTAGFGLHRHLHDQVQGFNGRYRRLEDIDYSWRIQLAAGITPVFEQKAVVHYRLRRTPDAVFRQSVDWGFDEILLYKTYGPQGLEIRPWCPIASPKLWHACWKLTVQELLHPRTFSQTYRWWKWTGYYVGCLEGCSTYGFTPGQNGTA